MIVMQSCDYCWWLAVCQVDKRRVAYTLPTRIRRLGLAQDFKGLLFLTLDRSSFPKEYNRGSSQRPSAPRPAASGRVSNCVKQAFVLSTLPHAIPSTLRLWLGVINAANRRVQLQSSSLLGFGDRKSFRTARTIHVWFTLGLINR
jgi:hypothetical protein